MWEKVLTGEKKHIFEIKLHSGRMEGMFFFFSQTHPPVWSSSHSFQLYGGCSQRAKQTRSFSKYTPPPLSTAPIVSLFPHPFSRCHSKRYSQLVMVHYTLSSWPEIYTPQCLSHAGEEGCNPCRLVTVHVSWWKCWITWIFSVWIYNIQYYHAEWMAGTCTAAKHDSSVLFLL